MAVVQELVQVALEVAVQVTLPQHLVQVAVTVYVAVAQHLVQVAMTV